MLMTVGQHCAVKDVRIMLADGFVDDDEIAALMVPQSQPIHSSIVYRVLGHLSDDANALNAKCLVINTIAGLLVLAIVIIIINIIENFSYQLQRCKTRGSSLSWLMIE